MKPTEKDIKEIAELLDCGHVCYYHQKDGKIENFIEDSDLYFATGEKNPWDEIRDKVKKGSDNYIRFEPMESRDSYRVMEDFAYTVDSPGLKNDLIDALNRRGPFQNFKFVIDNSGEYRQKWFDFKNERYIEWVEDQLPF